MKNKIFKIVTLAALIILSIIYMIIPYNSIKLESSQKKDIDDYIESKMKELRVPGLALGIVDKDDIYLKGYNRNNDFDLEVTAQSPFLLGSTTKSITAMAVMQLVEQKKIDLDEKVITYLPSFQFKNKMESDKITVRQLLNQTSGISGNVGESDYLDAESTRKDFLVDLKDDSIITNPGDSFQYAEANFVILGELISVVSGESYENYIQKNIFAPLKMNHSYTDKKSAIDNGLVQGNITWFGYPVKTDLPYPKQYTSASAIYSSAEDLTHYISCYFNEGKYEDQVLVSKESIREIEKPGVKLTHPVGYSYGMGWFINSNYVVHDGRPTNYYSVILLDNENKTGIVLLANANNRLITAEYFMPIAFEIVNKLNGIDGNESTIGFRQMYKILNIIFLWIFLILVDRIIISIRMALNKIQQNEVKKSFVVKILWSDLSILLGIICILAYLLKVYGVNLKIAYLGQPDIVFSMGVFLLLTIINLIIKVISYFISKI